VNYSINSSIFLSDC